MKFLLPIIFGTTTVVLASTFFFSNPIKKAIGIHSSEEIGLIEEYENPSVSQKFILGEDEIADAEEIKKRKKIIYDIVNEVMEIKNYQKKELIQELEIKEEEILEEIPAEKPGWIFETPVDNAKQVVYFVGESFGEEKYESAFEKAKMNSMIELCQFIKKRIEVDTQLLKESRSEEFNKKLVKKIASLSKNTFMRETKVENRYYLKLKPNKNFKTSYYQFFTLLSYPKKNIDNAIKEGLIYEKELLQNLVSTNELKRLQDSIDNFGKESKENELKKQMDHERKLLFSRNKIENLYTQSMRAEQIEKKGKLLEAYREYLRILNKIQFILKIK